MTDEKFAFISDVREKAQTGRSSHNRKPHAGKGGRVRLQSDNLTRKELLKLNGETKTYRMNDPMKWAEFKAMPDDLKKDYIKAIRERWNTPDRKIAEMFGVTRACMSVAMKNLGIAPGKRGKQEPWDNKGFYAWAYRVETKRIEEAEQIEETQPAQAVPNYGSMTFTGKPAEIFATVEKMLKGGTFHITISWESVADG